MSAPFEETKVCRGVLHDGGVRLPATRDVWIVRASSGRLQGPCRECRNAARATKPGPHGLVPVASVAPLMRELVDRAGSVEAASALSEINEQTVRDVLAAARPAVRKRTVRLLIVALAERRKADRRNGSSARFLEARRRQAAIAERLDRLVGY